MRRRLYDFFGLPQLPDSEPAEGFNEALPVEVTPDPSTSQNRFESLSENQSKNCDSMIWVPSVGLNGLPLNRGCHAAAIHSTG